MFKLHRPLFGFGRDPAPLLGKLSVTRFAMPCTSVTRAAMRVFVYVRDDAVPEGYHFFGVASLGRGKPPPEENAIGRAVRTVSAVPE